MRRLWAASAAIVVCLALGGLPVAGQESSEQPSAASTTIGFSSFYTDIDFFGDIRRGAQEAASTAGVELIALNAYGDPTMQADHLESFIADGVDAIIIAPVDPDAIVPSVEAANAAGIPVLAVDRTASGGMITSLIASDNVAAARMAGEALFRAMGGSGKVVEIQGDMAVSTGKDRSEGFQQALEAAPGITLAVQAPADFSYRLASQATRDALEEDPDITGVFAANLDMLEGATQAVASAGMSDQVRVVGFDTSPTILTAISDGSIDATIAQQPLLMGRQAVEAALAAVAGEPVEPFIPVETILVTAGQRGRVPDRRGGPGRVSDRRVPGLRDRDRGVRRSFRGDLDLPRWRRQRPWVGRRVRQHDERSTGRWDLRQHAQHGLLSERDVPAVGDPCPRRTRWRLGLLLGRGVIPERLGWLHGPPASVRGRAASRG